MKKHITLVAIFILLSGCFSSLPVKSVYEYEDMGIAMANEAKGQGTITLPSVFVLAPLVHSYHLDNWGDDELVGDNTWWKGDSDSADLASLTDKVANQLSARFSQMGFQLYDHNLLKQSSVAGMAQPPTYVAGRIPTTMVAGTFAPNRWNAFSTTQTDSLRQAFPNAQAVVFVDINSIWSRAGGVSFMNKESMEFIVDLLIRITVCQSSSQCTQTYLPASANSLRTRMPVPMKSVGYDADVIMNPVLFELYAKQVTDTIATVISR